MSQLIICFTIASYFRFVHNVFSFIIPFLAVVAMLVHNTSSDYNNNSNNNYNSNSNNNNDNGNNYKLDCYNN